MPTRSPQDSTSSVFHRLRVATGLLIGLRRHDLRVARTFVRSEAGGPSWLARWARFAGWAFKQMFAVIPDAARHSTIDWPMSRTPIWLADGNPWANHPWSCDTKATLPEQASVVVIGAGFTGAGLAYHWSKAAPADQEMVVLEMDDPASGSSGRNAGIANVGRYFANVYGSVLAHLERVRPELSEKDRQRLAWQFASVYCRAAYKNMELVKDAIREDGIACDFVQNGWVQVGDESDQDKLARSAKMAADSGYTDWTSITPDEAHRRSGLRIDHDAGFSASAASFHPARWVWSLLDTAPAPPKHAVVHADQGVAD